MEPSVSRQPRRLSFRIVNSLTIKLQADYHSELSINLQKSLFEIQNNTIAELGWITHLRTLTCVFVHIFIFNPQNFSLTPREMGSAKFLKWSTKEAGFQNVSTLLVVGSPQSSLSDFISQNPVQTKNCTGWVVWLKIDDQVAFSC